MGGSFLYFARICKKGRAEEKGIGREVREVSVSEQRWVSLALYEARMPSNNPPHHALPLGWGGGFGEVWACGECESRVDVCVCILRLGVGKGEE